MESREYLLEHAKLGPVVFRKVARSRSVKILVRPAKGVLVTLPAHVSFASAELFVNEKVDWVYATMQRLKEKYTEKQTLFTPETEFNTYSRKVQLQPEERSNVRVQITDDTVFIYYPATHKIEEKALQTVIRKVLEHAWKVEAHEVLPQRLAALAVQHQFLYKRIIIKNTRSYWGMCAPDNTITLNVHLMHLPQHLIDFIILHELCHTIHKNHGAKFWELLTAVTAGKARLYSREMRQYSTIVY